FRSDSFLYRSTNRSNNPVPIRYRFVPVRWFHSGPLPSLTAAHLLPQTIYTSVASFLHRRPGCSPLTFSSNVFSTDAYGPQAPLPSPLMAAPHVLPQPLRQKRLWPPENGSSVTQTSQIHLKRSIFERFFLLLRDFFDFTAGSCISENSKF
ncbi:hypothetical protein AABB24_021428, partial [Solanum stoloniferum]